MSLFYQSIPSNTPGRISGEVENMLNVTITAINIARLKPSLKRTLDENEEDFIDQVLEGYIMHMVRLYTDSIDEEISAMKDRMENMKNVMPFLLVPEMPEINREEILSDSVEDYLSVLQDAKEYFMDFLFNNNE